MTNTKVSIKDIQALMDEAHDVGDDGTVELCGEALDEGAGSAAWMRCARIILDNRANAEES